MILPATSSEVHDTAEELVRAGSLPQIPSFFECLTALAFAYFAEAGVEIAVLEVGMGGRLDATNVVRPLLSVITDISLDHMEWLGPTIAEIAREKAGILRPSGTLVTLPQHPEASRVLGEVAAELDVRGVSAVPYMPPMGAQAWPGVPGRDHGISLSNLPRPCSAPTSTATWPWPWLRRSSCAVTTGSPSLPRPSPPAFAAPAGRVGSNVSRPVVSEWILDVAHNPAGAWALRAGLRDALGPDEARPMTLVFACLRDKPLAELAQILFPLFERVIFPRSRVLAPLRSKNCSPPLDPPVPPLSSPVPSQTLSTSVPRHVGKETV